MNWHISILLINYMKCSKKFYLIFCLPTPWKSLFEIKIKINVCTFRNGCLVSDNYVMSSWAPLQLYGLREAEKGDSCVRMLDFRNRKERVTNLGEGSNFSGLGWGKPSRRTSFSVTFYNPINSKQEFHFLRK